jgi:hypothetical protein
MYICRWRGAEKLFSIFISFHLILTASASGYSELEIPTAFATRIQGHGVRLLVDERERERERLGEGSERWLEIKGERRRKGSRRG